MVATSPWEPSVWTPPAPVHWFALAGLGFLGAAGHFTLIKAFENASLATVAPLSYSIPIRATLFGYAIFGDLPDRCPVPSPLPAAAFISRAAGATPTRRQYSAP